MSERWKMNRMGFVNFWLYDDECFELEDGKMLLRGPVNPSQPKALSLLFWMVTAHLGGWIRLDLQIERWNTIS